MSKKTSATTYGTIALVGILAFIGFLSSGWESIWSIVYFILGILIFATITILLMKFIPEIWVMVILFVLIITFLHVDIQSWLFTIIISCLAIILIFTHFKLHKRFLSLILFIIIIGVYYYAAEYGGFQQEVNVKDTNIENVNNEMEAKNGVTSSYLSVEDDMVYCTFDVEGTVTKEETKILGENCRSILAKEVTEDNRDLFYENYKLTLLVKIGESEDILYGVSSSNDEKITWSKTE